jgi:DNA polymerase-3 subunit beta
MVDDEAPVLRIEQGRRKYKLPVNDATWFQTFADFPEEGAVLWSGDFLQELIDKIMFCIGDEGTDALACLAMKPGQGEGIEAAGMNGHQFAMISFTNDDLRALLPPEGILAQKRYLGELKKWLGANDIDVNIGDRRLFVRTENKSESFSLPLSSYQYPDYSVFLSRLEDEEVSVLSLKREEAQNALQRLAIFNSDSNRCTYFDLSDKEAVLSAAGQDVGSASESLDVAYNGSIERIAFPTNNLLTILDHFASSDLNFTLTGAEGPCGIKGEGDVNYLVIIMPMKILEEVNYNEEEV